MKGVDAYRDTSVTTQSKGRLVVMLYSGAVKFLKMAVQELEAGDYEAKGRHIGRAQDIIGELNAVLDMEAGGDIAVNLRKLYDYMTRRLFEANARKDAGMVQEVIGLLEELNEGWKAIAE